MMVMDLDDTFNYGKYRGYTVREVIEKDRGYVKWCIENFDKVIFSEEVENEI